jgi:hypothetical protein
MKKTATLFLLFAFMATGLLAQPVNSGFTCTVNGTPVSAGAQLPDAEEALGYYPAYVRFEAPSPQGQYTLVAFVYSGPSADHPDGINGTTGGPPYGTQLVGAPTSFSAPGTYTFGICAVWKEIGMPTVRGTEQFYTIELRPFGYGVVYPPPPSPPPGGGSGSKSGSGGSDASCSTVAGSGPLFGGTLVTMFGALFWRREKKPQVSPARIG